MQSVVVLDNSASVLGSVGDVDAKPEAPDLMVERSLVYETNQTSETVGALVVTLHSGEIWRNVKDHLKVNALILVVMAAALIGVTLVAVRIVIARPIGRLLDSIERMRSERVLELVDWQSADERGRVVDAYNEMQTKQAEAEAALIEHQNHLEEEVAARTAELSAKEAQLRIALASMPGGMFMSDKDNKVVVFNEQFGEWFGIPEDLMIVGGPVEAMVRYQAKRGDFGEGDADEQVEQIMADMANGEPTKYERHLFSGRIVEINIAPTPDGGEVAVYTDITERKRAEEELRESEAHFVQAARMARLGHWAYDETTNGLTHCSEELARIHGVTVEEFFVGFSIKADEMALIHPDDREEFGALIADMHANAKSYDAVYRALRPDGTIRHVREVGQPIFDDAGAFVRMIGTSQDITERKNWEEELHQERGAAPHRLGQHAGRYVHVRQGR